MSPHHIVPIYAEPSLSGDRGSVQGQSHQRSSLAASSCGEMCVPLNHWQSIIASMLNDVTILLVAENV